MRLRRHIQSWKKSKATTAVLDHGANPGLVSHFVKQALQDISVAILEKGVEKTRQHALEKALGDAAFPQLACLTGAKVIHISERDSQIINRPKEVGEFVNTWSIEGLFEESVAPAELGWGTHEKTLPSNAHLHEVGPGHQICLEQMGMHTKIRSWVPSGEIIGMLIRHGEAFTISEHLSINDGDFSYRPTVHYAYCPSDATLASLHELAMQNYAHPTRQRVVSDEIISGVDELGVLLMGHDFNSWWTGSSLDIDTARTLVPGQNATTLQVAASVISAIEWMLRNPDAGIKVPDELPYQEILATARPYLGDVLSIPNEWTPLQSPWHTMASPYGVKLDKSDPWQFHNFLAS
jgi:homospermidine synthase